MNNPPPTSAPRPATSYERLLDVYARLRSVAFVLELLAATDQFGMSSTPVVANGHVMEFEDSRLTVTLRFRAYRTRTWDMTNFSFGFIASQARQLLELALSAPPPDVPTIREVEKVVIKEVPAPPWEIERRERRTLGE